MEHIQGELMKQIPSLTLTFKTPTAGYWNGGLQSGGTFTPEPCITYLLTSRKGNFYRRRIYKDKDGTVKWGSFGLNFWFRTKFGRSWKHAAAIAKNKLRRTCKKPCTIVIEGV